MSIVTLTTASVRDTIVSQMQAEISTGVPLLPKSFTRVIATVLSGVVVLLYKYAGFIFLQIFVAHATMTETTINGKRVRPLVLWGRLIGVGDPEPSTRAELVVSVTVTNQVGSLSAGVHLLRGDALYQVVAPVPLNASVVTARIRATTTGTAGNLVVGDVLKFANPIQSVAPDVTVTMVQSPGEDGETQDAYRSRIVARFQAKPKGGAPMHYWEWGTTVPGIKNVFPYPGELDGRPGEVDIYVESTPESSGNPDGIPTTPQLSAVYDAIQGVVGGLASRRPVGAAINVRPIEVVPFTVSVRGLSPESSSIKAHIQEGVAEYFRTRAPYIQGVSSERTNRITAAAVAGVVDERASEIGASIVEVSIAPGPAFDLTPRLVARLHGNISWVGVYG